MRYLFMFVILCGFVFYAFMKYNCGDWAPKGSSAAFWDTFKATDGIIGKSERPSSVVDKLVDVPLVKNPSRSMPVAVPSAPRRRKNNSLHASISPYVDPKTLVMLARMGLDQVSGLFMASVAPVLDAIIPRRNLHELELAFRDLADKKVSVHESMKRSILPILKTTGIALVTIFPFFGAEVIDGLTELFEGLHHIVDSANPKAALHYFSTELSEWLVMLLGLGHSYVGQAASILDNFVMGLLPRHEHIDIFAVFDELAKGHLPSCFPSFEQVKEDAIATGKALAALKAQDAIASSISSYMNPHSSGPAAANPLIGMATSMLGSMLNPDNSDGSHGKSDGSLGNLASSMMKSFISGSSSGATNNSEAKETLENPMVDLASNLMKGFLKPQHAAAAHGASEDSSVEPDPMSSLLGSLSSSTSGFHPHDHHNAAASP